MAVVRDTSVRLAGLDRWVHPGEKRLCHSPANTPHYPCTYTGVFPVSRKFSLTVLLPVSRRFPEAGLIRRCAQVMIGEKRDLSGGDIFPAGVPSEGSYAEATEI